MNVIIERINIYKDNDEDDLVSHLMRMWEMNFKETVLRDLEPLLIIRTIKKTFSS